MTTSSRKKETAPGSVRDGGRWLIESGIQNLSRDSHLRGGVASWYEMDSEIYPFLYSEITGYALTAFHFLYRLTNDKHYLRAASLAKDWLLRQALHADGGVKTRFYLVRHYVSPNYCFHQGRIYSFDTAMVGYGLLQHYKQTGDVSSLDAAGRIANFLVGRMRRKDGLFHAYFDTISKKCGEDIEKWSDQAGTFHGKLALFFIDYYRLSRNKAYQKVAVMLLDNVLQRLRQFPFFSKFKPLFHMRFKH